MTKIEILFDGKWFWVKQGEEVSSMGADEVIGTVVSMMGEARPWGIFYNRSHNGTRASMLQLEFKEEFPDEQI